jgi:hypothetical protein
MCDDLELFEDKINERKKAVLARWPTFLKAPLPPQLDEVVDRSRAELPAWFVPWAPAVAIASDHLLSLAQYQLGSRPPPGWEPGGTDAFTKVLRRNRLLVRGAGEFWLVERDIEEVLVFTYGSLPLLTRTCEGAMWLAEHCHTRRCEPLKHVPGLSWVVEQPCGVIYLGSQTMPDDLRTDPCQV